MELWEIKFSSEAPGDGTLRTDYKGRHDSRGRREEAGQEGRRRDTVGVGGNGKLWAELLGITLLAS